MKKYQPRCVLEITAELGESPVWSAEDRALFWLDLHKQTVNCYRPEKGANQEWSLPAVPGCIALGQGASLIIAMRDGIYDFDHRDGALKRLADPPFDVALYRFNDGRCDRQGRFWVGAYLTTGEKGKAFFYRYDGNTVVPGVPSITIPNGTAFSPDGRTMYHAESDSRQIFALDYDPLTGEASNSRLFAEVPAVFGLPDGAAIDSEGGYWVALPLGPDKGGVARFTSEGRLDHYIAMPTSQPTMVAFGGDDMSTLFITSASHSILPMHTVSGAQAGAIFAMETDFTGIPETRFRPVNR